ncbi:hypothetical protein [Mesorhizobium sp. M0814]|uniref:hypothetical protein n=1 Tax=unclassified Mesorhizobium TaxID=325217 RepID=UPI00333AC0C5
MLADHRPGQIESRRRGCERAQVDGFDEHGHARKAIHIQNLQFLLIYSSGYLSA